MKRKISKILILLTVLQSIAFALPFSVSASQIAISGDAKVLNTGYYLDFTNENSNVKVDSSTGKFTGYVFSDDVGWIDFGDTDNAQGPVYVDLSTGYLRGKAYILNTQNYIDFGAENSNVRIEGATFSGYVFSIDVGWIDFSDTGVSAASAFMEIPTASWGFNEDYGQTINDSSYDHDGTLGADSGSSTDDPTWTQKELCVADSCLSFDGGDYVNIATTVKDVKTVSFWVRPKTDSEVLLDLDGGSHKLTSSSGTITATGFSSVYVNAQASTPIVANEWQHIVATTSSAFDASAVTLGKVSTSYLTGFMDEVRLFGTQKSADQVKGLYAAKASPKEVSSQFGPGYEWMSNGLVGYWKMDEASWTQDCTTLSVTDSSGNGKDGKSCPSTTGPTTGTGKFGKGGSFDGTNDYVIPPSAIPIRDKSPVNTEEHSIALWFNTSGSSVGPLVMFGDSTTLDSSDHADESIGWRSGTGNLAVSMHDGVGDHYYVTSSSTYRDGNWHHLTVTLDESSFKLYVDGSYIGENTTVNTQHVEGYDSAYLWIAARSKNSGSDIDNVQYFTGLIDDLRVYNRALSPSEVSALYNWAPGPVGYWPFDENTGTSTVYDRSGNGNNGTMQGTMTEEDWVPGKFGSALDFDGDNDVVSITDSPSLSGLDNLTVEGWVKYDEIPSDEGSYESVIEKEASYVISGRSTTNKFFVRWGSTTTNYDADSITTIQADTWYYVTLLKDGSSLKVYINGNDDTASADTPSGTGRDNSYSVTIGDNQWGGAQTDGIIDDVRVYNYARTPSQIIEDMNAGHPAPGSPVGTPIGHWRFDEGYGDTTYDSGTGGNNGDLAGSGTTCPQSGDSACPTWTNSGKFGKALSFDTSGTTDDYVDAGNPTSLQLTSTGTISVWVNYSSNSDDPAIVCKNNWTTDRNGYCLARNSNGKIKGELSDASSKIAITSTNSSYDDSLWHHVVFTWNGSMMNLYIDGAPAADPVSQTIDPVSNVYNLTIGKDPASTTGYYYYNGLIDEVKIYNFALTPEQVRIDMNMGGASTLGAVADHTNEGFGGNPPVVYVPLDENTGTSTVYDKSGSGFSGTMNGSMTEDDWVPGKAGSALHFDGNNDRVVVGDISSKLNLISSNPPSFTYSAWMKPETDTPDYSGPKLASNDGSGQGRILYRTSYCSSTPCFGFQLKSGSTISYTNANAVTLGNWYLVTGTYDQSTHKISIYLNGVWQSSNTAADYDLSTAGPMNMTIGYNQWYFKGAIDDVRVYDYVLSQAQIAYLYNRGEPTGWWRFDECQGATAHDSSERGHDATIYPGDSSGNNDSVGTCNSGASDPTNEMWNVGTIGKRNASLGFDGTNDYVGTGTAISNLITASDSTISVWVKPHGSAASATQVWQLPKIVVDWDATDENYIMISRGISTAHSSLDRIWLEHWDGNEQDLGIPYTVDEWVHIVFLHTGGVLYAYKNGELVDSVSAGNTQSLTRPLYIGGRPGAYFFNGQIDEVKTWNYALTADQIKREYNEGAVRYSPATGSP